MAVSSSLCLGAKGYAGVVGAVVGHLWLGQFGDSEVVARWVTCV